MSEPEISEDFQSMRRQDTEWPATRLMVVGALSLAAAVGLIYFMAWSSHQTELRHITQNIDSGGAYSMIFLG